MVNKKLRKRDRAWNVIKSGAKRTRKVFQKGQPVLNKARPIINPRNALFGSIPMLFLKPSMALAVPNLAPEVADWNGKVTIALLLAGMIEESSCMMPDSQWVNSKIGAPLAVVGTWECAAGASVYRSFEWHTKKFIAGTAACTGYVIGAHRAAPHDPILTATRAATSATKGNAEAMGSA
jgi:hypothetical protein